MLFQRGKNSLSNTPAGESRGQKIAPASIDHDGDGEYDGAGDDQQAGENVMVHTDLLSDTAFEPLIYAWQQKRLYSIVE